jgi:hypothetical protein
MYLYLKPLQGQNFVVVYNLRHDYFIALKGFHYTKTASVFEIIKNESAKYVFLQPYYK